MSIGALMGNSAVWEFWFVKRAVARCTFRHGTCAPEFPDKKNRQFGDFASRCSCIFLHIDQPQEITTLTRGNLSKTCKMQVCLC